MSTLISAALLGTARTSTTFEELPAEVRGHARELDGDPAEMLLAAAALERAYRPWRCGLHHGGGADTCSRRCAIHAAGILIGAPAVDARGQSDLARRVVRSRVGAQLPCA
nr:hypothetical protein [Rhodococcus erythropolis]